jgi:hypothetical protein
MNHVIRILYDNESWEVTGDGEKKKNKEKGEIIIGKDIKRKKKAEIRYGLSFIYLLLLLLTL